MYTYDCAPTVQPDAGITQGFYRMEPHFGYSCDLPVALLGGDVWTIPSYAKSVIFISFLVPFQDITTQDCLRVGVLVCVLHLFVGVRSGGWVHPVSPLSVFFQFSRPEPV